MGINVSNEVLEAIYKEDLSLEWVAILTLGAKRRKQIIIEYKYLDKEELTVRIIEPLQWEVGRKGLHILTHSPEDKGWRRFAIRNLTSVGLTNRSFITELPVKI